MLEDYVRNDSVNTEINNDWTEREAWFGEDRGQQYVDTTCGVAQYIQTSPIPVHNVRRGSVDTGVINTCTQRAAWLNRYRRHQYLYTTCGVAQ